MKDLLFCMRIDSQHVKEQRNGNISQKNARYLVLRWFKAKYYKGTPSSTSNVSSIIFVDLRINGTQFQAKL